MPQRCQCTIKNRRKKKPHEGGSQFKPDVFDHAAIKAGLDTQRIRYDQGRDKQQARYQGSDPKQRSKRHIAGDIMLTRTGFHRRGSATGSVQIVPSALPRAGRPPRSRVDALRRDRAMPCLRSTRAREMNVPLGFRRCYYCSGPKLTRCTQSWLDLSSCSDVSSCSNPTLQRGSQLW
jgi:hypothetical protein